jgi:transposase
MVCSAPKGPSARFLDPERRLEIILLHKQGVSKSAIARKMGVDFSTVTKWVKHGSPFPAPRKPQKTRCVTPQKLRRIKAIIKKHDIGVAREVTQYSPRVLRGVSTRTIQYVVGCLLQARPRSKSKAPALSAVQKQNRVAFAQANLDLDIDSVVWTDESMFQALGRRSKQVCLPGQTPRQRHVVPHPPQVHVWGAISSEGVLFLKVLDENVTSKTYCETINEFLQAYQRDRGVPNFILQQDNARPHTAHATKAFLSTKGIRLLDNWPANSPDLNPIEDVWAWMKRKVFEHAPYTRADLEASISQLWGEIPPEVVYNTVLGFRKHVRTVIEKNGEKSH